MAKGMRVRYVVGVVLLLSVSVALPVLAQMGLEHFMPREVETLPQHGPVTHTTIPADSRYTDIEALESRAGFSLLVPTYLPPGCLFQGGDYRPLPREATLVYACVWIAEKQADSIDRPFVGEGSIHEVDVGGRPAIYVDGAWMKIPGEEELIWTQGPKQLIFERDGLVIRMTSFAFSTEEELIRIAESME